MTPRPQRPQIAGFTLVELLVVIGIIALLISILIPALSKAREQSLRVKCLSNIRQLATVNQMYANDNKLWLPFSSWGQNSTFPNAVVNWLYTPPLNSEAETYKRLETGSFYPYLKTHDAYKCPGHSTLDRPTFGTHLTDLMTSFLMNGATCGYGASVSNGIAQFKITKFRSDSVLFWEADERGGVAWNDGASYPWESFNPSDPGAGGLASRHGKVATVACFDGHAEWMTHDQFKKLADHIENRSAPNRFWCSPLTGDGH
jgi:prepilin-type N-terminal cleavage/methylation domain-containing protein